MSTQRLALAISTYHRASMLAAIIRAVAPTCRELGIPIHISDNASTDDTPNVCRELSEQYEHVYFTRHEQECSIDENMVSALDGSSASYTWWSGDDDYISPSTLVVAQAWLERGSPDGILFPGASVPSGFVLTGDPVVEQLQRVGCNFEPTSFLRLASAAAVFAGRYYNIPIGTLIVPTARIKKANPGKYYGTHHAHSGAFYEMLSATDRDEGGVDVWVADAPGSVSLTPQDPDRKTWAHLKEDIARRALPEWLTRLPPTYDPYQAEAREFHRHIFRDILT